MNLFAGTHGFMRKVYFIDFADFAKDIDKTSGIYLHFHDKARMKCYSRVMLPATFGKRFTLQYGGVRFREDILFKGRAVVDGSFEARRNVEFERGVRFGKKTDFFRRG
jgi:hypothetical protein